MNAQIHRPLCVALAVMIFSGVLSMACFGQESIEQRFQKSLQAELKAGPIISAEIIPPAEVPPLVVPRPLTPVPDPAFQLQPTFDYLPQASAAAEKYYVVFFTAPWCGPCRQFKRDHLPKLQSAYPVTITDVEQEPQWKTQVTTLPAFWLCRASDREPVAKFTGSVTVEQLQAEEPQVTETAAAAVLENAPKSIDTLAAAMAWHVLQSESEISHLKSELPQAEAFGSLLDVNADVPDVALELGRKILSGQRCEFPAAGLTLDWSGPKRTVAIERGRVTISPGVAMTVSKWRFTKSCRLDAIAFTDDLSAVTFELSGMLDLTVNLR